MRKLTGMRAVLAADARQLPFKDQFDCVIADVSCSGTGTLARNPEIKWRLKPEDPGRLAALQLEILNSVSTLARTIVYSTCSLDRQISRRPCEFSTHFSSAAPAATARRGRGAIRRARKCCERRLSSNHSGNSFMRWILRGNFGASQLAHYSIAKRASSKRKAPAKAGVLSNKTPIYCSFWIVFFTRPWSSWGSGA